MLAETGLAEERRCSLLAEQAELLADSAMPTTALADDSDAAIRARDTTASAVPALAEDKPCQEDKWRQEEAAAKQCRADD